MPQLACPSCGAVVDLPALSRSSEEFCPSCDFPLFWASSRRTEEEGSLALAVRRRPGTSGRQLVATETCPECQELNRPTAVYCQRCGAVMHPAPPAVTPVITTAAPASVPAKAAPRPAPLPAVEPRPWWQTWIVVALLFFLLGAVVIASMVVLAVRS